MVAAVKVLATPLKGLSWWKENVKGEKPEGPVICSAPFAGLVSVTNMLITSPTWYVGLSVETETRSGGPTRATVRAVEGLVPTLGPDVAVTVNE